MTDTRVMTTEHLIALNDKAKALSLNCVASDEFIARLDPDGRHLATIQIWGHNMDHHQILHHRVYLWCRTLDTEEPAALVLDMDADDWDNLTHIEEILG